MDSWDPKLSHHSINISFDEQLRVECVEKNASGSRRWCHCYGRDIIQKGMVKKWTFRFLQEYRAVIGIIDNDHVNDPGFAEIKFDKCFTNMAKFGGCGLSTINRNIYPSSIALPRLYSYTFKEEDELRMELDMTHSDRGTLAYLVEDDDTVDKSNIANDNIDLAKKYRLCVAFWCSGNKIALIHSN